MNKYYDTFAWEEWLRGEEGSACLKDGKAEGVYLRNRLWHAFMAGRDSLKQAIEELKANSKEI